MLEFGKSLEQNLLKLHEELEKREYSPKPLKAFVIRDPKSRKICKSDFRDRIVHHALCNVIGPIFEKAFIFDSFANRRGKGMHKALDRFDEFKVKASKNFSRKCFVLKCDIRHYFETVDINTLLAIIGRKVDDERVLWLVNRILGNYRGKLLGKGMPLGNLTSQFFANVYLHELDLFAKHELKARYYLRYVDDFVIISHSRQEMEHAFAEITLFLRDRLLLELHEGKSRIVGLEEGVQFLGMRVFPKHRLLAKKNLRKLKRKLDKGFDEKSLAGWNGLAMHANTFKLRKAVIQKITTSI